MIKCSRDGNETAIEVNGSAQVVAADCCEIISAIYRAAPSPAREVFKASVLLAVTHKDSPMWSLNSRGNSVALHSVDGELERQIAELRREGGFEGGQQRDKN